jgi:hypothetical protein
VLTHADTISQGVSVIVLSSALLQAAQALLFRNAALRRAVGIPPLPASQRAKPPTLAESFRSFTENGNSVLDRAKDRVDRRIEQQRAYQAPPTPAVATSAAPVVTTLMSTKKRPVPTKGKAKRAP